MNSLLHGYPPIVLFVVVFLAVLLLAWRWLSHSSKKPANWSNQSLDSGSDLTLGTVALDTPPGPTPIATSSEDAPDPSGIVAEVCSLEPEIRESVEESYRGRRVRWTLSLSAISEREERDAGHIVRMYPSGRSPYSCGVYFLANPTECAVLQAAGKNDAFVVEGVIEKIEDRDIDLTNVRMVEKAA